MYSLKELHPGKWTVTYTSDGNPVREEYDTEKTAFRRAAYIAAYDDIYEASNICVNHSGRTYRYAGWQPRMLIQFVGQTGAIAYESYCSEYDH